jgi:hypothetical protein
VLWRDGECQELSHDTEQQLGAIHDSQLVVQSLDVGVHCGQRNANPLGDGEILLIVEDAAHDL